MEEPKLKFAPQETPEHKYVVAFDTICAGWDCVKTEDNKGNSFIELYTKEEAEAELKEDAERERESCKEWLENFGEANCDVEETGKCTCEADTFIVPMEDYIHERKTMFTTGGIHIEGTRPAKSND